MNNGENKQIFYSTNPRRWSYSKRVIFAVAIFLIAVFGVTFASIFLGPTLPQIGLNTPEVTYRAVPNVPKSDVNISSAAVPGISQNLALVSQNNSVPAKPKI